MFADSLGQMLLDPEARPPDWFGLTDWSELGVVIVEGEIDFLTWATRPDGERQIVVFGVVEGSWSTRLAQRIPSGCTVTVRTHHDKAGHRYADKIFRTLSPRVRVLRSPAPSP